MSFIIVFCMMTTISNSIWHSVVHRHAAAVYVAASGKMNNNTVYRVIVKVKQKHFQKLIKSKLIWSYIRVLYTWKIFQYTRFPLYYFFAFSCFILFYFFILCVCVRRHVKIFCNVTSYLSFIIVLKVFHVSSSSRNNNNIKYT